MAQIFDEQRFSDFDPLRHAYLSSSKFIMQIRYSVEFNIQISYINLLVVMSIYN